MSPSDIEFIASLIPRRVDLDDARGVLDYVARFICPAYGFRPSEAERALDDIIERAKALKLARAA